MHDTDCPNNYDQTTYSENFFVNEKESTKCESCPHLVYKNGIMTCDLFSNQ